MIEEGFEVGLGCVEKCVAVDSVRVSLFFLFKFFDLVYILIKFKFL